MIIRELRETEFAKKCEISAIAFNYPIDMQAKSEILKTVSSARLRMTANDHEQD